MKLTYVLTVWCLQVALYVGVSGAHGKVNSEEEAVVHRLFYCLKLSQLTTGSSHITDPSASIKD